MNFNEEISVKVDYEFSHRFNHTLHAYIDIAGDLIAGTLLSQIMYWFSKDKSGNRKVKIYKDGYYWLAKGRNDWVNEIRISPKQYDNAIKKLKQKGFVETKLYKFESVPTTHIRPIYDSINKEIKKWKCAVAEEIFQDVDLNLPKGEIGISPNGKTEFTQKGNSLTETTNREYKTEITDTNKVFSNEKTIYNNKVSPTGETYRSPDIPYDYTEEEFKDFITKKTDHILHGISPEEKDASVKPISAIISYFYKRYYECIGERHPILTDMVYAKIIMKLLDPADEVCSRGFRMDKSAYCAMIDQFFQTAYGVKSGNITDYRMPYFIQDTVQNNLVYKSGIV